MDLNCGLCPRLAGFRAENRKAFPDWFNSPVPSFGSLDASLLIVGLAPGLRGANRTGRPFTGDYAGDLLYETLLDFGFARGQYNKSTDDGLQLLKTRISNSVRCVPPQNKPLPEEIKICNQFLRKEFQQLSNLRAILALGAVAHRAILMALDVKATPYKFSHHAIHSLDEGKLVLFDSYHCSRYNTQTNRLTREMFRNVFASIKQQIATNR